jgi:hypothetical protein
MNAEVPPEAPVPPSSTGWPFDGAGASPASTLEPAAEEAASVAPAASLTGPVASVRGAPEVVGVVMAAFTASVDGAPARETESVVACTVPVAPATVSATGFAVLDTGAGAATSG